MQGRAGGEQGSGPATTGMVLMRTPVASVARMNGPADGGSSDVLCCALSVFFLSLIASSFADAECGTSGCLSVTDGDVLRGFYDLNALDTVNMQRCSDG